MPVLVIELVFTLGGLFYERYAFLAACRATLPLLRYFDK